MGPHPASKSRRGKGAGFETPPFFCLSSVTSITLSLDIATVITIYDGSGEASFQNCRAAAHGHCSDHDSSDSEPKRRCSRGHAPQPQFDNSGPHHWFAAARVYNQVEPPSARNFESSVVALELPRASLSASLL